MPYMPKILVRNLPVKALVSAAVDVEDGPEETLQQRVEAAVRAGRWERARGEHAGDLRLKADHDHLDYPLWSFDIIPHVPATPATPSSRVVLTYGMMPSREQYDAAWREALDGASTLSFEGDPRVGTVSLNKAELWHSLLAAHAVAVNADGEEASAAGTWCSDVLGALGIEWV